VQHPEQTKPSRFTAGFVFWGAYFAIVLMLIAINSTTEFRLIRLDARVHQLMTTSPGITLEGVKSELADVVRGENEGTHDTFHYRLSLHFGEGYVRDLYLDCDAKTHEVLHWSMVQVSDVVDTAEAADGRATRSLILSTIGWAAIGLSPIPFLLIRRRITRLPLRLAATAACTVFCAASAGIVFIQVVLLLLHGIGSGHD